MFTVCVSCQSQNHDKCLKSLYFKLGCDCLVCKILTKNSIQAGRYGVLVAGVSKAAGVVTGGTGGGAGGTSGTASTKIDHNAYSIDFDINDFLNKHLILLSGLSPHHIPSSSDMIEIKESIFKIRKIIKNSKKRK